MKMTNRLLFALLALLFLTAPLSAQRNKKLVDTVMEGEEELLAELGLSYAPFRFMHSTTDQVELDLFIKGEVLWLETPHFRIGSMLKKWKIPVPEKKAYRAELERMQQDYPHIDPKMGTLDPWMRLHLYGWRMENMYDEFLDHMGFTDEDFRMLPGEDLFDRALEEDFTKTINDFELERGGQKRSPGFPQWVGMGQYLGEPYKFEIFLVEEEAVWAEFKLRYCGIKTPHPQRWNVKVETLDQGITQARSRCLSFGLSTDQVRARHDQHVHNALRHNLAINFLDGYMLYLFDMPAWIREGYAHYMRRLNNHGYNFFDSGEGAAAIERDDEDWAPEVRKLVKKDEAVDFARLARINDYVDLAFEDHLVVWSKIDFLIQTDKEKFGKFILQIKTQGTGAAIADVQRDAFRDLYGWTMRQAEEAWKAWVLENYGTR